MPGVPFQLATLFVLPNIEGTNKVCMYVWFREESKRILFPEVSYSKVLEDVGLKTLFHRHKELCSTLFKQIVESDGQHKLAGLLPA